MMVGIRLWVVSGGVGLNLHLPVGSRQFNGRFRWSRLYPSVILLMPVLSQFGQFLSPDTPVFAAQPLGVLIQLILIAVATVLWLNYRPAMGWSLVGRAFFMSLLASWLIAVPLSIFHDDALVITAGLLPVLLGMFFIKRPNTRDVTLAGDSFAWSLVSIAVIAQMLEWCGLKDLHYEGWNRSWIQIWDTFPFLFRLVDYGLRWEGPFGNVNFAGPIGAFLVVYGVLRLVFPGFVMVVTGLTILFVSDSRSAWMSTLIAVVSFFAVRTCLNNRHRIVGWLLFVLAGAMLGVLLFALWADGSEYARRTFWEAYLRQALEAPFHGVGGRGIQSLISEGLLPSLATHGHSIIIDPLLRYGWIGTAGILVCLGLGVAIAVRSVPAVRPGAVALVVLFLATGLAEDLVNWTSFSIAIVPLILVALIGDRRTMGSQA